MPLSEKQFKILLVEDNMIVMMTHRGMLEEIGCDVYMAENGAQALSMAKNGYDLIFMDIGLPDMNGMDVTHQIRQLESGKAIPIVGLTAYDLEEVKARCLSVGMDDIISKPTTTVILEKLIKTYVT